MGNNIQEACNNAVLNNGVSEIQMADDADGAGDGIRRNKPNQFDNLCDGVLNNLALVHTAMGEVWT